MIITMIKTIEIIIVTGVMARIKIMMIMIKKQIMYK